jgi:hypothetical protein
MSTRPTAWTVCPTPCRSAASTSSTVGGGFQSCRMATWSRPSNRTVTDRRSPIRRTFIRTPSSRNFAVSRSSLPVPTGGQMNERDPARLRYRSSISRGSALHRPRNYQLVGRHAGADPPHLGRRHAMGGANHWDFEAALPAGGSHGYPDLSSPPAPGQGRFRPGTDG